MSLLPQQTTLGCLELLEVYEFYDKPCLFSCKNISGQIFMAVWVDKTSYSDSWFYVATSIRRLLQIISGGIELKNAFLEAEDRFIFEVIISSTENKTTVSRISCENLDEEMLPVSGEFLNYDPKLTMSLLEKRDAKNSAIQFRRPVLNLAFSFPGIDIMQAPAVDLGNLLQSAQYLIDAIGQFKAGESTVKGSIPEKITRQTRLAVAGTFAGSFGVEMIAFKQPGLFGDSLVEDAIETFLNLIKIGKNSEELRIFLLEAQPRVASRHSIFLQTLINSKAKMNAEWGSFSEGKGNSAELILRDAKIVLSIVNQVEDEKPREYKVEGELVGINKRTKSFEIWESKGARKKYSGRILDSALSVAQTATLSGIYIATILEVTEVSLVGEEKPKYSLVSIRIKESEEKGRNSDS